MLDLKQDYFALFGLPTGFAIDMDRLEQAYLDIQGRVHPDRFAHLSDADKRLSSGPGVGEGLVVVGGLDGDVIALDRDSGSAKWATNVSSEVLANPVIEDGIVVVRSNDGRVFGLNATDGSRVWLFDRGVPLISLRGNATPVVRDGQVYVGYDNGKFVALQLADGTLQWEQTIAAPEGRTELERMGDIDGEIVASDGELYMVTYRFLLAARRPHRSTLLPSPTLFGSSTMPPLSVRRSE